jgi:CysZ protein
VAVAPPPASVVRPTSGNAVGEFFAGIGLLVRGLALCARSPRLWLLGLIPAVISFVLLAGGFVALAMYDGRIATLLTPFAEHWAGPWRTTVRAVVEIGLLGLWLLISVLVFTALTLLVGQPFYEAISKRVDDDLGGIRDEINVSFWRVLPRNIVDSIRVVVVTALAGLLIFGIGLVPLVGQVTGAILGAFVGGWAIVLELTSVPFERRGKFLLRHRREMLRARRPLALGFGVAAFVCLLVPGVDVLFMPGAVAGATLLSRRVFGDREIPVR